MNTDKPNYQMGETVTVWGEVSNNGEAVADEDVAIQVGSVLFVDQVPTDSEGQWSTTFVLNPELFQELQAYDVWAWSIGAYDQTSFTIDASDPQPTPQIQEPKRLPEKDFKNPRQRRG